MKFGKYAVAGVVASAWCAVHGVEVPVVSNELADGDIRLVFDIKCASLTKVEVGGVNYSCGKSSFVDRVFRELKPGLELLETIDKCSFRQELCYNKDGKKGVALRADSTGFPGVKYFKRYELSSQGENHVLTATFRVDNKGAEDFRMAHSCSLALHVGEGRNTFIMPTASGKPRRYEYPGCTQSHITEMNPTHCAFGVMDDSGAGFVLYTPSHKTAAFDSWLDQENGLLSTEEYYGVNDTIKPGTFKVYQLRLVFTKDVEKYMAANPVRNGKLDGAPSTHLRKWENPPKQLTTLPAKGGAGPDKLSSRERLKTLMEVPVDLLQQVNIADVGYHEEWFKPCDSLDMIYVYNPGKDIISNGKYLMSELAARMNFTFRTVPMIREVLGTYGNKPYSVYPTFFGNTIDDWSVELLREAATRVPKVVLVQGHDFAYVQKEVVDVFADLAKKGAGLVFVNCTNVPESLCGKKRDRALEARAMILPQMQKCSRSIVEFHAPPQGGKYCASLYTVHSPNANPSYPGDQRIRGRLSLVHGREFPFGEYMNLAIVKAVRIAAGMEGPATFAAASEKGVEIVARVGGKYLLKMKFKDFHRFVDAECEQELQLAEGANSVKFAPPALPGGGHVCELRLVDGRGKVVDAAAFRFDTPDANPIALSFSNANRIYDASSPVAFTVSLPGGAPAGSRLAVELEDSDFRVIRRAERPAADGAAFEFAQALDPMLLERVIARLVSAEGKVLSKAVEEVSVRMRPRDLRDTSAYITIRSMPRVMPLLRDIGLDFVINSFDWQSESIRQTANLGMTSIPRGCAGKGTWFLPYRADNPKGKPSRDPCFSSDAYKSEIHKRISEVADCMRYDFYNVRYHWLGDECFLGSTVCYSPTCLADFRRAMESKYGDVGRLNAKWGTSFASFADVMPCQLEEIADKSNLARWLEHKMFMARQFAEKWIGGAKKELNAVSPGSFAGPTGTAVPGYGWDWSQMMKQIDAVGYYGGAQRKFIHDFAELYGHEILAGQCGGGYTHAQYDYEPYNYDTMWSGLLKGSNLAYHYFGAAIDGDYTMTSNMQYWAASLAELKGGIGKMWLSGQYRSEVSVLYSQPSLFVAMATVGKDKWQNSMTSWWRILSDLKVELRFLPYEYLAKGVPDGVRVLVLPYSVALSDAEREAIARFAAKGGKVLADVAPGGFDEAGVKTGRGVPSAEQMGEDVAEYCAVDLGGAAGETASTKSAGVAKALAIRGRVSKALAAAGVRPEVTVTGPDGNEYACDAPVRRDGETTLFAMHVDTYGSSNNGSISGGRRTDIGRFDLANGDRVVAHLPEKGHVYDVRARRYVGFTDEISTTLVPGYTRMYAVLRSKPAPVRAECPASVKAGGVVRIAFSAAGTVGPQVFNVRIVDPDGKAPWRFRRNIRSLDGRGEYTFETALNDRPGKWRAVVTHVDTGSSCEAEFAVE